MRHALLHVAKAETTLVAVPDSAGSFFKTIAVIGDMPVGRCL